MVCAAMLGEPRAAQAGAFDLNDTGWEGESELLEVARIELGTARVHAVAVLNWDEVQPEDGVLAIHPMQAMNSDDSAGFMKAGGRLAILDDYGHGNETLERFHITRAPPPTRPLSALRNRPALAIAEPVYDVVGGRSTGPHPVVAQLKQLVTNHPTGLRHPNLSPVLRIRAVDEPDVILAVAGQVGKGRLFAMSDPSVTINEMLRYPGNRAFVVGLVRYLVDDDGAQKRGGKLFLVTNRFEEDGAWGGQGTLRKDLDTQVKALAGALADARREGFPIWVHILGAVAAAVGLASWVAGSSARPYRSPLPGYVRPTLPVAQGGVAGHAALLAAPTTPRSLTLLELKRALVEGLSHQFGIAAWPSDDTLVRLTRHTGVLDESTLAALKEVLAMMRNVETAVAAGRTASVSAFALARAADVVRAVLVKCGYEIEPNRAARDHHHPAGDIAG